MTYEKPMIIDLSNRSEKGFGGFECSDGSGQIETCAPNGSIAQGVCTTVGGFFGGYKYED